MIITTEYLDNHKTAKGAWTRKQLEVIGVDWPAKKGWKNNVLGIALTEEQQKRFEEGRFKTKSKDRKKYKKCFVYFIRSGRKGSIKIGYAIDPDKRLKELQTGNPYPLTIVATIECDSMMAAQHMESSLHYRFRKQNVRGEWFMGHIKIAKVMDVQFAKQTKEMKEEQEEHDNELLANCPQL